MRTTIKEVLQQNKLFSHLTEQELNEVNSHITTQHYKKGELIVTEGDVGEYVYIITKGSVQVFTYTATNAEVVLARLDKGNYFGEQALLMVKPMRRNASVRALTDVDVLTISHTAFQKCLQTNANLHHLLTEYGQAQLRIKFLQQLQNQDSELIELISLFNHIRHYGTREVFFRQKDTSLYAYFLLSGNVELRTYDEGNRIKSRKIIYPGQFFGERGIIDDAPYANTAVAITDTEVAIIDAHTLLDISDKNPKLNALLNVSLRLYQVPMIGLVTQYQTSFLGQPAINTTIQKKEGEVIIASRLINADIFSVYYQGLAHSEKQIFRDADDHSREIMLLDNKIVGVMSIGKWDDLADTYLYVQEKITLSPENLHTFLASGKIQSSSIKSIRNMEGILCECMQVRAQVIQDLILEGVTSLEEIQKRTAAGTVCGSCRPKIIELLGGDAWFPMVIDSIREHNGGIRSYRFRPLKGQIIPSLPGQHLVLEANIDGLPITRSYTLTSVPENQDYYEITVKREPQGFFSGWLFEHGTPGTTLRVSAPQGEFIFNPESTTPALCFMGGIGITPAIAFARQLISSKQVRRLHLDYSVRSAEDITFQDELKGWSKDHAHLSVTMRITSQEGHIQAADVQSLITNHPDADIFICGPKPFENAITTLLDKAGIPLDKIHLEHFNHAGGPVDSHERRS